MEVNMRRNFYALLISCLLGTPAFAGTIDSAGTYHGTIQGVGVGFFGGIGVGLTDGATCNGSGVVILLYSNPQYKDMLAVLLAGQASGGNVRMYQMANVITSYYSGTYAYCTITSVSLGDFPLW